MKSMEGGRWRATKGRCSSRDWTWGLRERVSLGAETPFCPDSYGRQRHAQPLLRVHRFLYRTCVDDVGLEVYDNDQKKLMERIPQRCRIIWQSELRSIFSRCLTWKSTDLLAAPSRPLNTLGRYSVSLRRHSRTPSPLPHLYPSVKD